MWRRNLIQTIIQILTTMLTLSFALPCSVNKLRLTKPRRIPRLLFIFSKFAVSIIYWQLSNFRKKSPGRDSNQGSRFYWYHKVGLLPSQLAVQHTSIWNILFKLSMNNLISIVTLTCDGYVKKKPYPNYNPYNANI